MFLNKRNRIVDLKKALDSIYRNALRYKLFNFGIKGRTLRTVRDMYSKVQSCVKSLHTVSDFFHYAVGLRQGEVLSPLLFSLFVEEGVRALYTRPYYMWPKHRIY